MNHASPWLPAVATISAIKQEAPAIATYRLRFDDPQISAAYRFEAGQFNMLALPGIGECAISISSDPADLSGIDHTIRIAGNVTSNLAKRKPGAKIAVRGPFGSPWPIAKLLGQDVVIASGGVGMAPLRPVLRVIQRRRAEFGRVTLLYGARTPSGLLFTDEYEQWRSSDIDVQLTVDLGDDYWRGNIGVVPAFINRLRLVAAKTHVLTCGPEIMMRYVALEALARGVKTEQVYISMERNMSCGIGQCGHCQFGPAFICRQGPVFTYRQIEPYLHVEEF
ncbi:MAG TPA: FAD/NAD(P)-binding protein [Gemmataceae bacterium]|nr:FAD/NAD(P)-binding protein [Gemmataceae bacterium]